MDDRWDGLRTVSLRRPEAHAPVWQSYAEGLRGASKADDARGRHRLPEAGGACLRFGFARPRRGTAAPDRTPSRVGGYGVAVRAECCRPQGHRPRMAWHCG
jgi:hypothetical protein